METPDKRQLAIVGLVLFLAVAGCGYLLSRPILQIWWAVYGRTHAFLSVRDLLAAGLPVPCEFIVHFVEMM